MGILGILNEKNIESNASEKLISHIRNQNNKNIHRHNGIILGAGKFVTSLAGRDTISTIKDLGLVSLFWGEILNRSELIGKLNLKNANDITDADLFCYLYKRFESDVTKQITGSFSAAVWDENKRELRLYLDRTGGIHGLYYSLTPKMFAFSTSIPELLSIPGVPKNINRRSVFNFFATGYVLPPNTLLDGIRKVIPGTEIIIDENLNLQEKTVDSISIPDKYRKNIDINEFKEILSESLKRCSSGDIPKAFLLSGGIDSSINVTLASKVNNNKIQAISAAFPGTDLDESKYAKIVADHNSCDIDIINMNRPDLIEDLPRMTWFLDEPTLDYSIIPTYCLFNEISKKYNVVISGDGPDHIFGRYYPLAAKRALAPYSTIWGILGSITGSSIFKQLHRAGSGSYLDAYNEIFIVPEWGVKSLNLISEMFSGAFKLEDFESDYCSDVLDSKKKSYPDLFNQLTLMDYMIDGSFGVFAKIGKMAKANNIVMREPFLDRTVVDYVLALPVNMRVSGSFLDCLRSRGKGKYLLKHLLGPEILPAEIINKPKGGFTPPLSPWLRDTICQKSVEQILCKHVLENEYFNIDFLRRMFKEHASGQRDWTRIIFMLISFDLWVRINIEEGLTTAPAWKLKDVYEY